MAQATQDELAAWQLKEQSLREALERLHEMAGYAVYHLDPEWARKNRSDLENALQQAAEALAS